MGALLLLCIGERARGDMGPDHLPATLGAGTGSTRVRPNTGSPGPLSWVLDRLERRVDLPLASWVEALG